MGARRKFSRGGGGKPPTPKRSTIFGRAEGANENMCVFRDILTNFMGLYIASAGGASKNFRVFRKRAAYDVIFKFQGWVVASRCGP